MDRSSSGTVSVEVKPDNYVVYQVFVRRRSSCRILNASAITTSRIAASEVASPLRRNRSSAAAERVLDQLRATPAEGYAACCEAVGAFDFRSRLAEVVPPTLVLHGADDPVTPPAVVDELAGGIRGAQRTAIPRAAHLANVEQPSAFTDAVLSHLAHRAAA